MTVWSVTRAKIMHNAGNNSKHGFHDGTITRLFGSKDEAIEYFNGEVNSYRHMADYISGRVYRESYVAGDRYVLYTRGSIDEIYFYVTININEHTI